MAHYAHTQHIQKMASVQEKNARALFFLSCIHQLHKYEWDRGLTNSDFFCAFATALGFNPKLP